MALRGAAHDQAESEPCLDGLRRSSRLSEKGDPHVFEVERLLEARRNAKTGRMEYLVEWKGFPVEEASWEKKINVCAAAIKAFEREAKVDTPFASTDSEVSGSNRQRTLFNDATGSGSAPKDGPRSSTVRSQNTTPLNGASVPSASRRSKPFTVLEDPDHAMVRHQRGCREQSIDNIDITIADLHLGPEHTPSQGTTHMNAKRKREPEKAAPTKSSDEQAVLPKPDRGKKTTVGDEPEPGWFFVDKLLQSRRNRKTGQREYLVKWANYPVEEATWVRRENISSRLVEKFDADQADGRVASRKKKAEPTKSSTDLPDATKPHRDKSGPTVADKRVPCEEAFDSKDPFKGEIDILRKQFPNMKDDLALWNRLDTGEITVDDLPEEDRWMAELYSPPAVALTDLSSTRSSSPAPTVFTFHTSADTPSTVSRRRRNPARAARPMAPAPPTSVNEETEGENASDWSLLPFPDPVLYQKGVENLCRDPFIARAFANSEGSRRTLFLSRPHTHRSYAESKQIRYPGRAPCWGDSNSSSTAGTSGADMEQVYFPALAALLDPIDID